MERFWVAEYRNGYVGIDEMTKDGDKERVVRNIDCFQNKKIGKQVADLMNYSYNLALEDIKQGKVKLND